MQTEVWAEWVVGFRGDLEHGLPSSPSPGPGTQQALWRVYGRSGGPVRAERDRCVAHRHQGDAPGTDFLKKFTFLRISPPSDVLVSRPYGGVFHQLCLQALPLFFSDSHYLPVSLSVPSSPAPSPCCLATPQGPGLGERSMITGTIYLIIQIRTCGE